MITDSRPVQLNEFLQEKFNNIHDELFNYANDKAIEKYIDCVKNGNIHNLIGNIDSIEDFKKKINIIEIKNNEYWKSSYVIWKMKSIPFKTISMIESGKSGTFKNTYKFGQMSLEPWWNKHQYPCNLGNIHINIGNEKLSDFSIIYINYVKGMATLKSKYTGKIIELPFNKLNGDIDIDESLLLNNTFMSIKEKNKDNL